MTDFTLLDPFSGVWTKQLPRFEDERGFFTELFRESDAPETVPSFVQDSLSFSKKNVLRGMHVQTNQWQLVTLLRGELIDVVLDVSPHSPTFGQSQSIRLGEGEVNQILLRPGFAHGYAVLSEDALIHYKSTVYYGNTNQYGVLWSSPELVNYWPRNPWIVSERDSVFPAAQDFWQSGVLQ